MWPAIKCTVSIVFVGLVGSAYAAEPVPEFERFVAHAMKGGIPKPTAFYIAESRYWTVQQSSFVGLRYDVQKTSSLVSPVIGQAAFVMLNPLAGYDDETQAREAARRGDRPTMVLSYSISLNYIYRNGRWQFRNGSMDWLSAPGQPTVFDATDLRRDPNNPLYRHLRSWLSPSQR